MPLGLPGEALREEVDEGPYLGRDMALLRIDDVDRERLRFEFAQQRLQAAGAQVVHRRECRRAGDAEAGPRSREADLRARETQPPVDPHRLPARATAEVEGEGILGIEVD